MFDIGCNSGLFSAQLARECRAKKLCGVDIDAALIAHAALRKFDPIAEAKAISFDGEAPDGDEVIYPYFPHVFVRELGAVADEAKLRAAVERERQRVLQKVSLF